MPDIDTDALESLPVDEGHRRTLVNLAEFLVERLGDDLANLSIYGSAARDEWHRSTSDINLFLLLEDVHFGQLSEIGQPMADARKNAKVVPMTLTVEELRRAADVYCVKFASIRRHHISVIGEDHLSRLDIDDSHLRFVCEFQLRNVAMRMRQFYLQSFGQRTIEQRFLLQFFESALFPLRALTRLHGLSLPEKVHEDFEPIGRAVRADATVLERLSTIHREGEKLDDDQLEDLYERLSQFVRAAVRVSDKL